MTTIFAGFYCDYSWHTKGYWFSSKKEIVLLPKKKKARSQVHLKQVDTVATKAIINLSACHILNLIINTRLLGPPIFPISQISVMLSHFVLRQRLDSVLLIFSISNTDNSNRSVNNPYFHLFLSSTVSHFCFHSTIVCISLLITLALFYINITVYTFSPTPNLSIVLLPQNIHQINFYRSEPGLGVQQWLHVEINKVCLTKDTRKLWFT